MKKRAGAAAEPTQDEISQVAYRLFEEGGRKDGHDVEHWLQARALLVTASPTSLPMAMSQKRNERSETLPDY